MSINFKELIKHYGHAVHNVIVDPNGNKLYGICNELYMNAERLQIKCETCDKVLFDYQMDSNEKLPRKIREDLK
jgi:hypothetical protein|tara:strand:+ start:41 stop:262 length:222 start_codon:yes stop_codon:yes gene_type:complete